MAEMTELESVATESKRPAKRPKVVCGSESGVNAPLTTAYLALLAIRNEFMNRCEALMFEKRCIAGLAKETKWLRAKFADMEKSNALTKGTSVKRKRKYLLTVIKRRVKKLEAEWKGSRMRKSEVLRLWKKSRNGPLILPLSLKHHSDILQRLKWTQRRRLIGWLTCKSMYLSLRGQKMMR